MRARSRLACGRSTLLVLAVGVGACERGPEPPTGPTPPSQTTSPQLVDIRVVGPGSFDSYLGGPPSYRVAPGETAQFRAIARFSDGSTQDVTSEATWLSSNYNILSSAGAGLFTGQKPGTATVVLEKPSAARNTSEVVVLAPDTYVVAGQVFESRDPLSIVNNASITVMTGPGQGQVAAIQTFNGYRLYGLAGPTTLRIAKDGYRTQDLTIVVSDHQMFDIDLPLAAPRAEVAGTYTMTVTAADECRTGLGLGHVPEEARERRYTALVTQNGPELSVELTGGAFTAPMPSDSHIEGRVEPRRVTFDLVWWDAHWDFGPPRIVERLSSGEVLVVSGTAATTFTDRRLAGTLRGEFISYAAGVIPRVDVPTASFCFSENHRFVLSR